jgi:hypothetical protein
MSRLQVDEGIKMLTDEQILQKATLLLEKISENSDLTTEVLLREISDSEMLGVEAILQKLADNPRGALAFDDLFGDKTRLVIPFPVKNRESELGQWVHMLEQVLKVDVDWKRGMVSVEREWEDHDKTVDDTVERIYGDGPPPKMLKKKLQMKIGKYFAKLDSLMKEYLQIRKKIGDYKYKDRPEEGQGAIGGKHLLQYTIGETEDALSDEELKRYKQILNQLELYAGGAGHERLQSFAMDYSDQDFWKQKEQHRRDQQDAGDRRYGKPVRTRKPIVVPDTKFIDMGTYWLNNSKTIREDVPGLENDTYSIILTRHPVDVMRMSDFEKITSCHTPPSRDGSRQEYYKCAVAEAQGHGAIAYVVKTDDLLSETNTGNIESAEQELEEYDEIFVEQNRYLHGTNLDLDPVSRIRLRQFKFFDREKYDAEENKGTEVAVPEKYVYGIKIPGLVGTVTKWARQNQEEVIANLPKSDGKVDLDDFRIYGGSYEDTAHYGGRKELLANLTNVPMNDFTGQVEQDKETEDEMPPEWVGDVEEMLKRDCAKVREKWNSGKYANCEVDFHVRDDSGEGDYVIYPEGKIMLTWELDEWKQLPNVSEGRLIADYLNENYYNQDMGAVVPLFEEDKGAIYRGGPEDNEVIIWRCEFNTRFVPGLENQPVVYDADGYENYCKGVDALDDDRDKFQALVEQYAKENGYFEGHAYMSLIQKLENGEIDPYEWDVEYDGEHHTDSYEAWASISYDFDPEQLGIETRILFDLVDRREFALMLREYLTRSLREELNTDYRLSIRNKSAVDSGGDVRYSITFKVDADTPDKLVEQFYELVTGDMDDEDEIAAAFMGALQEEARKNGINLGQPPAEKQRNFDDLKDLGEVWRRFI